MMSTPGPHNLINLEEEMKKSYVEANRKYFSEEILIQGLKLLDTLEGGIEAHRDSGKLFEASWKSNGRMDCEGVAGGFPDFKHSSVAFCEINTRKKGEETNGVPAVQISSLERGNIFTQEDYHDCGIKSQNKGPNQEIVHQKRQKMEPKEEDINLKNEIIKILEHDIAEEKQKNQALEQQLKQMTQRNQDINQEIECLRKDMLNLYYENIHFAEKDLADKQRRQCHVCMENEATVICRPCNHIPMCQVCSTDPRTKSECPLCRREIKETIILHYS